MRADVLNRTQLPSTLKDGDLLAVNANQLRASLRNFRSANYSLLRLFLSRQRSRNPTSRFNCFPQLLSHRFERTMPRQSPEDIRQIIAGHVFHDFDRRIRLTSRRSADENIHGLDDVAINLDVLSQKPDIRDRMIAAAGGTPRPMQAQRLG